MRGKKHFGFLDVDGSKNVEIGCACLDVINVLGLCEKGNESPGFVKVE
jgi:hypothetical protein